MDNIENHEKYRNSGDQNVNIINYNEQYDSQYDSSDNNYVAMLEQNDQNCTAELEYYNRQYRM